MKNPCANTVIDPSHVFPSVQIYLDDPDLTTEMYSFPDITDSVSDAQGNSIYCGAREFAFNVTDLITVISPGSWKIRADSPSHGVGTVTVEVTVTL